MQKYNNRNEVPEKYKWDLTSFFKDENDFNKRFEEVKKDIECLKEYKNCTKNAKKLYEYLKKDLQAEAICEDLYVYSYLINDQELGNATSIERKNKVELLCTELESNTSFFAPELLKLDQEEYNQLFINEPKLNEYKSDLDKIYREKKHILTESEEKIITTLLNAMNSYDDISSNLLNNEHNYGTITLEDGTTQEIATNNYRALMHNNNREIRKNVYEAFYKVINQYSATNAALLNSYVNMHDKMAKIRHFNNSWESRLFSLNLNNNVFEALINATEDNLDILQKYFKLRKKVLNLDNLHLYDLNVEIANSDKKYSIEEAQQLILDAIKPLGKEYTKKFKKIFDNNYIDYCQYKGKCSGAYSFSTIMQDSRILMSYNGGLEDVSTIAHEGGHNVHHQYIKENNPMQYRNASSIIAEVASLTNECLLSSYLSENGQNKEERLTGISNIMDVIVSNLFGSVREGKIEQEMYKHVEEDNTITKEFMNNLVYESLKKYYGNTVELDDEYCKNSWVRRSHYYMHFYLYSYAICISVACTVASKILNGDEAMLDNYLKFLKVGSDKWPKDAFDVLGINLEDKEVYENAIKYFDNLINKFENIYDSTEVK